MSMVKEVILTDKDGQQILPITRHTQVYVGNERLSAYLDNSFGLLSTAVQSLQSQIDSVASRDSFDELHVTSFFADTLVGTDMYGTLHGNADSATTAAGYTAGGGIAAALAAKQNTINADNKLPYSYLTGTPTIGNGTIYITLSTGPSRRDFQMFTLNQTGNKVIGLYRGSHIQIEHTAESGSLSPEGFTISTDIVDADDTHKGLVTTVAQTLAGDKTFTGNVTSDKQIVGKQGVAAEGISDLAIPAIKGEVQDYKDLIHKTATASGSTYPFALDAEYKRQYLVLTLTQVQTAVTFDTSTPCAEQYILLDNPDDTAKTVSVVSSLANGLVVGDTAIEVAAYESVEVSIITTAADASEYDSSWTGKLCVVKSHAIKWD